MICTGWNGFKKARPVLLKMPACRLQKEPAPKHLLWQAWISSRGWSEWCRPNRVAVHLWEDHPHGKPWKIWSLKVILSALEKLKSPAFQGEHGRKEARSLHHLWTVGSFKMRLSLHAFLRPSVKILLDWQYFSLCSK